MVCVPFIFPEQDPLMEMAAQRGKEKHPKPIKTRAQNCVNILLKYTLSAKALHIAKIRIKEIMKYILFLVGKLKKITCGRA